MSKLIRFTLPSGPLYVNPAAVAAVSQQERPNGRTRTVLNVAGREYVVPGEPDEVLMRLGLDSTAAAAASGGASETTAKPSSLPSEL